jgi:CYTH domain-containing protein
VHAELGEDLRADAVVALLGRELVKLRHHIEIDGLWWSLDLFRGALAGLEVIEIEASDKAALAALVPPSWTTKEVTHDPRYQCGSLVQTNAIPE